MHPTHKIFFLVALLTLALTTIATSLTYATLGHFTSTQKDIFLAFGIIAPIFLVITFISARKSSSVATRVFIIFSNTLAGIYFYLILGMPVVLALMAVEKISGVIWNWELITTLIFFSAIIFGIIGHIQALLVRKVFYTVRTPHLPENWYTGKVALVSDLHFGLINQHHFAEYILGIIRSEKPTTLFIAGDFFDGPDFDLTHVTNSWKKLAGEMPIFYAPGNHEEYGPYQKFMDTLREIGITVLQNESTLHNDAHIIGYKYHAKHQKEDFLQVTEKLNAEKKPFIAINHAPLFQKELAESGAILTLSGHTHRGQFWPFRYITKAIYGIYHTGMNTHENLTQITSRGAGTAGTAMRLFNQPEVIFINFEK